MKFVFSLFLTKILLLSSVVLLANPVFKTEIDGKMFDPDKEISLYAGQHELIFYFPETLKSGSLYSFKLAGLEANWLKTSNSFVRYTLQNGGNFEFNLKYLDINNQTVTINRPFEIKENFWEKWWFYLWKK